MLPSASNMHVLWKTYFCVYGGWINLTRKKKRLFPNLCSFLELNSSCRFWNVWLCFSLIWRVHTSVLTELRTKQLAVRECQGMGRGLSTSRALLLGEPYLFPQGVKFYSPVNSELSEKTEDVWGLSCQWHCQFRSVLCSAPPNTHNSEIR